MDFSVARKIEWKKATAFHFFSRSLCCPIACTLPLCFILRFLSPFLLQLRPSPSLLLFFPVTLFFLLPLLFSSSSTMGLLRPANQSPLASGFGFLFQQSGGNSDQNYCQTPASTPSSFTKLLRCSILAAGARSSCSQLVWSPATTVLLHWMP